MPSWRRPADKASVGATRHYRPNRGNIGAEYCLLFLFVYCEDFVGRDLFSPQASELVAPAVSSLTFVEKPRCDDCELLKWKLAKRTFHPFGGISSPSYS